MPISPTVPSCAIQVAGRIQNQSSRGIPSVARTAKNMQQGFRAAGIELEDGSAAGEVNIASRAQAAEKRGSVKVAGVVSGHPSFGLAAVRKTTPAVKRIKQREGLCGSRSNQEEKGQK
jgi:hypothetical protein